MLYDMDGHSLQVADKVEFSLKTSIQKGIIRYFAHPNICVEYLDTKNQMLNEVFINPHRVCNLKLER